MCTHAAELIKADWLPVYEERLERLWFQSVQLNATLYLLGKISEFPVELFALDQRLFWSLVAHALYESSIMTIGRIVGDRRKNVLTLPRFREELVDHAVDDGARESLEQRLGAVEFEESVDQILEEVVHVRNDWIAHLKREAVAEAGDSGRGVTIVPLDPLQAIRDAVNCLIDALTLDGGKAHIYMEYSGMVEHPPGMDSRPDIEKILDMVVGASPTLRMPEEQPEPWRGFWEGLSEHERTQFNKYRLRHELKPYHG